MRIILLLLLLVVSALPAAADDAAAYTALARRQIAGVVAGVAPNGPAGEVVVGFRVGADGRLHDVVVRDARSAASATAVRQALGPGFRLPPPPAALAGRTFLLPVRIERGAAVDPYLRSVERHLGEIVWNSSLRRAAQRGTPVPVTLAFRLGDDGRIADLRVGGRISPMLAEVIERAVTRLGAAPPPPPAFVGRRFEIRLNLGGP